MQTRVLRPLMGFALAGALALAACGGGGDDPLRFDPERADELAHAALPGLDDLPGSGWTVVATDDYSEEDDELPPTESCTVVSEIRDRVDERSETNRAGRAKIEFLRPSDRGIDTEVEVSISIFDDNDTPIAVLDAFGDYFESDALGGCFNELLEEALAEQPGTKVTLGDAKPHASRPEDSQAVAIELTIEISGQSLTMLFELYAWRVGNAGVSVDITGAKEDVTPERVAAILKLASDHVEAAATGK